MRYASLMLMLLLSGAADVLAEPASKGTAGRGRQLAAYSSVDADRRSIVLVLLLYRIKTDDQLRARLRQQAGERGRLGAGRNSVAMNVND